MSDKLFEKVSWEEVPTTVRGQEYVRDLKLNIEELGGKMVLDIGAGTRGFAKYLEEERIEAEVYSLDPVFLIRRKKEAAAGNRGYLSKAFKDTDTPNIKDRTIIGLGEAIPFKDETFDYVLSEYALPQYAYSREQISNFFSEVIRVVKKEGEIRLYPGYVGRFPGKPESSINELNKFIDSLLDELPKTHNTIVVRDEKKRYGLLILKKMIDSNSKIVPSRSKIGSNGV